MDELLTVATVLKPQGIRGEIKVKALTDTADDLKAFKKVIIKDTEYAVLSIRTQGDFGYLALRGIADRNAAELLRGEDVKVSRVDAPPLPEGRYYIVDLIGCEVVTEKGAHIGEVTFVTPAKTDIYTLKAPKGELSFAAAEGVILDIDLQGRKITVNNKRFKEVSI